MLVEGATPEIFDQVKDFVTVIPKNSTRLEINFAVASPEVLKAVSRSVTGPLTHTTRQDADSMVQKIVNFRNANDSGQGVNDHFNDAEHLGLNSNERGIFQAMTQYRSSAAQFLRIKVTGTERASGIHSSINAVVNSNALSIISLEKDEK